MLSVSSIRLYKSVSCRRTTSKSHGDVTHDTCSLKCQRGPRFNEVRVLIPGSSSSSFPSMALHHPPSLSPALSCALYPFVSLPLAFFSYGICLCSCYNKSLLSMSPLLPDSIVQTNYLLRDTAFPHETHEMCGAHRLN